MVDDFLPSAEEIERAMREGDEEEHRVDRGKTDEAYRFRSHGPWFSSPEYSVLIERAGDRATLTARSRVGLAEHKMIEPLTTDEWDRLIWALDGADFFAMPDCDPRMGLDGWTWTIEGRRDGRYRSVTRWCSARGEPFHDLGLVFLELAGFGKPALADATDDGEQTG
ncbi:MAG: hypothetical protein ACLQJR_05185 [Stellaceae bacterium]